MRFAKALYVQAWQLFQHPETHAKHTINPISICSTCNYSLAISLGLRAFGADGVVASK